MSTQLNDQQRIFFKKFNRFMILLWRLGLRRYVNFWPKVGGRIMVILHRGRKTGLKRLTPVNYAMVDGEIYCTAGFGSVSDWYRNILTHPRVEIWLPDSRWSAEAVDISDDPNRIPLLRQVLVASGIVAPLMGVHLDRMTDAELAAFTPEYRLVRIHPLHPISGSDGPGDLAWIWAPIGLLVFSYWLFVLRRK